MPWNRCTDAWMRGGPHHREEEGTQAMEWVQDPADHAATLIAGKVRARVWQTASGTWAALISVRGDATAAYSFATREAAQAWCEAQVAERRKPRP